MKNLKMVCRPGTQDVVVISHVLKGNEYDLPDEMEPNKVVIDVGANIGVFALACVQRGAGWFRCVEPHPENVALLRENLKMARAPTRHDPEGLPVVCQIDEAAVWSPTLPKARLFDHGPRTAMHTMCVAGTIDVQQITLEKLLTPYDDVQLLKLDCEGGEWPALLLTDPRLLRRCRRIVGEVHLALPAPGLKCDLDGASRAFGRAGFEVKYLPDIDGSDRNVRFDARRL